MRVESRRWLQTVAWCCEHVLATSLWSGSFSYLSLMMFCSSLTSCNPSSLRCCPMPLSRSRNCWGMMIWQQSSWRKTMKRYDWQQKLNTIVLQVATLSDPKLTCIVLLDFPKTFWSTLIWFLHHKTCMLGGRSVYYYVCSHYHTPSNNCAVASRAADWEQKHQRVLLQQCC